MTYLIYPQKELMRLAGYDHLAHIPVLLSADWRYASEANRFLRERALGEWGRNTMQPYVYGKQLAANTVRTYGRALENFLTWCETVGLSWREVELLPDVLRGYRQHMLNGKWSAAGTPLSAATINLRVETALSFLIWAGERGFRKPIEISPFTSRNIAPRFSGSRERSKVARVRQNPTDLNIPKEEDVKKWLDEVRSAFGLTKYLACKFVLETGARRQEVCSLHLGCFKSDDQLKYDGTDSILLIHGTKGAKTRRVFPSAGFLRELSEYRRLRRVKNCVLARRRGFHGVGNQPSDRFFLSDRDGRPIGPQTLYEAWTECHEKPFIGWSPHPGRHYYACRALLRCLETEAEKLGTKKSDIGFDKVAVIADTFIRLFLQPVMGHVSDRSTEKYLYWLAQQVAPTKVTQAHAAFLDG